MPDDLLVNLAERKDNLTALLERLPQMFAASQARRTHLARTAPPSTAPLHPPSSAPLLHCSTAVLHPPPSTLHC